MNSFDLHIKNGIRINGNPIFPFDIPGKSAFIFIFDLPKGFQKIGIFFISKKIF